MFYVNHVNAEVWFYVNRPFLSFSAPLHNRPAKSIITFTSSEVKLYTLHLVVFYVTR